MRGQAAVVAVVVRAGRVVIVASARVHLQLCSQLLQLCVLKLVLTAHKSRIVHRAVRHPSEGCNGLRACRLIREMLLVRV